MKNKLHPGARWLFRFEGYIGAILIVIIFSWLIAATLGRLILMFIPAENIKTIAGIGIAFFVVYILLVIIIAEIYVRMAYNRWFYEFTPTNLKVERGVIWKRYSNIPYERVQNVDIHRGVLARILGFSTVEVQTAGYSSGRKGAYSEGHIPAVSPEAAEKIREFLMKKITKHGQGL